MKTCFLFPGQGAQYPGMGKDLWESSSKVKELFTRASDKTGKDLCKLIFSGSEDELKSTDNAQIAITLVNLSAAAVLGEKGITSSGCAGFSLGEYAALVEAGVISIDDVFPIVNDRGRIMERVSRGLDSADGSPGMAAVIGLSYEKMASLIKESGVGGVYIANYNSPVQIVISGTNDGLLKAEEICKEAGARRYIRLKVSGPFHSPLLEEAKKEFVSVLDGYEFNNPRKTVYSNVTGAEISSGEEAKKLCGDQIISTVKWVDEEKRILDDAFDRCIEVGPGKVLAGLWRGVDKEIRCESAGTLEGIQKIAG